MNAKRWMLLVVAVSALCVGAVRVASADAAADLFQKSYDSEALGKLTDALAALDRLPASRREGYVGQLRRGWLLYRLGKHAEAIDAYNRAIALQAGAVEARVGVLLPQLSLRRWIDAEANARAVLRIDPGNYFANLRLAFTVYSLGRYGEAEPLYRKLGKAAEAAREFREVLLFAPQNALAIDGLKACGVTP
jgi:tetratricopeptide (TPR) repeat protein